jgi:hypothetical protein
MAQAVVTVVAVGKRDGSEVYRIAGSRLGPVSD